MRDRIRPADPGGVDNAPEIVDPGAFSTRHPGTGALSPRIAGRVRL
jgi:hypothetical protein